VAETDLLLAGRDLSAAAGTRLTVGIRPEDLHVATASSRSRLSATVEHVENLGHESLVHLRLAAAAKDAPLLVARIGAARPLSKGDRLDVEMDADRIHLFAENGSAID
jgi:ABC-type sugar transport system ATPase subunit